MTTTNVEKVKVVARLRPLDTPESKETISFTDFQVTLTQPGLIEL
jgi:hypothetical protein